jgi:hypothetical protein
VHVLPKEEIKIRYVIVNMICSMRLQEKSKVEGTVQLDLNQVIYQITLRYKLKFKLEVKLWRIFKLHHFPKSEKNE